MTDNQDNAGVPVGVDLPSHNYETLILWAGTMKYLIESEDKLGVFEIIQKDMTPEMQETLFFLLSLHISMDKQKILGATPVLQHYERLHPLFYVLSHINHLYYTTEDTLLQMKLQVQQHSPEFEALLSRQAEELSRKMTRGSKSRSRDPEFESLEREYRVRYTEGRRNIYSVATMNEIKHRVLPNLKIKERRALLKSGAQGTILAVLKTFNERFPNDISRDRLETSTTIVRSDIAPLYNYDMSMSGTLDRSIHYNVDNTKEKAKAADLRKKLRANPDNRTLLRQYKELQISSDYPFRSLRKSFDVDVDAYRKLLLPSRKTTTEVLQTARKNMEEHMKSYASICENTLPAVKQIAANSYKETAIFVEG